MALVAGCAPRNAGAPGDGGFQDRLTTRLERDVQDSCNRLVKGVKPGSVGIVWSDNLHPNAPMLSEQYVVSMYEESLIRNGFTIAPDAAAGHYRLTLTMTPSRNKLLVLASLKKGQELIANRQAYLDISSGGWNDALSLYRFRTKTRISLGSRP